MTAKCAACGGTAAPMTSMGGTLICAACRPDVERRINTLRAAGQHVDVARIALSMQRSASGTTYLLRGVPADLWTAAKHAAVDRGISLRELILSALRREIGK